MFGKPSMKTVKNYSGGAAEKAELRASRSKTEHRRATEPMLGSRRRIPSSTHVTENTANERVKRKSWQHKRVNCPLPRRYHDRQQKTEIFNEVTKWGRNQQEEICWQKWSTVMMRCFNKCYYVMKSQYNNISMLKVKQFSKTYNWEYNVTYSQWTIAHCGKISHKYNEVNFFSSSQNREEGGRLTRKAKQNYCQCCVTLPDCVGSLQEGNSHRLLINRSMDKHWQ